MHLIDDSVVTLLVADRKLLNEASGLFEQASPKVLVVRQVLEGSFVNDGAYLETLKRSG